MVQLTRIYTKGGDKGKTSLGSGARVLKSTRRIQAIGDVDEANCAIGLAILDIAHEEALGLLKGIQNDLFDVGADLCMEDLSQEDVLRIKPIQAERVERAIDTFNDFLVPLYSFVLPGGSKVSAALHMARAVARRAERSVVALHQEEPINANVVVYLNRLSDLLFVLARFFNQKGEGDILWVPGHSQDG